MIRVELPYHLRLLAGIEGELVLPVQSPATISAVLDAMEQRYPMLRGTVRDPVTRKRRPLIRFYCCEEDYSHAPQETTVPAAVASGEKPFLIVGAIAGG